MRAGNKQLRAISLPQGLWLCLCQQNYMRVPRHEIGSNCNLDAVCQEIDMPWRALNYAPMEIHFATGDYRDKGDQRTEEIGERNVGGTLTLTETLDCMASSYSSIIHIVITSTHTASVSKTMTE